MKRSRSLASVALHLLTLSPPLLLLLWGIHVQISSFRLAPAGELSPTVSSAAGALPDLEAEYDSLLSIAASLEDARLDRHAPVLALEILSQTVGRESGVWISSLVVEGHKVSLRGFAVQMPLLNEIARDLKADPAVTTASILSCRWEPDLDLWTFHLECTISAEANATRGRENRKAPGAVERSTILSRQKGIPPNK